MSVAVSPSGQRTGMPHRSQVAVAALVVAVAVVALLIGVWVTSASSGSPAAPAAPAAVEPAAGSECVMSRVANAC